MALVRANDLSLKDSDEGIEKKFLGEGAVSKKSKSSDLEELERGQT